MVRMCGVVPPLPMVNPILDAIFDAIQNSPVNYRFPLVRPGLNSPKSWRVRVQALPLVQGARYASDN